jgi:hypothetical protein
MELLRLRGWNSFPPAAAAGLRDWSVMSPLPEMRRSLRGMVERGLARELRRREKGVRGRRVEGEEGERGVVCFGGGGAVARGWEPRG